jgi:hypothetical protein
MEEGEFNPSTGWSMAGSVDVIGTKFVDLPDLNVALYFRNFR